MNYIYESMNSLNLNQNIIKLEIFGRIELITYCKRIEIQHRIIKPFLLNN